MLRIPISSAQQAPHPRSVGWPAGGGVVQLNLGTPRALKQTEASIRLVCRLQLRVSVKVSEPGPRNQ